MANKTCASIQQSLAWCEGTPQWKKSLYGRTLTDIKEDSEMVVFFAAGMNKLIRQILGSKTETGALSLLQNVGIRSETLPPLSVLNFQSFSTFLSMKDIAEFHSKHRVGAVFTFRKEPPKENNIIVFDDFVTTWATMISMRNMLMPLGKNLVFITAINNKL